MIKIVTTQEMRAIEQATDAAGTSYAQMMQHAGAAVAEIVVQKLGPETAGKRVAVLVGKGNNGGDGLVAARILKQTTQAEVGCYLLSSRSDEDEVFVAARNAGVFIASAEGDTRLRVLKNLVGNTDVLIDAILGTGIRLPVSGDIKKILEAAASALERRRPRRDSQATMRWPASPRSTDQPGTLVVAVDCPSGLNCDTGEVDSVTISADVTVTFGAVKHGHLRFPGADYCGNLIVSDIGIPPTLPELASVKPELVTGNDAAAMLPHRPKGGHKGTFGRVTIAAGSISYTGAAALAGRAAYRAGAGLVRMAVPEAIYPILAAQLTEAIWLLLPHEMGVINRSAINVLFDAIGDSAALLLGPGLGRERETAEFLYGLLQTGSSSKRGRLGFVNADISIEADDAHKLPAQVVIDADALNLLAELDEWWRLLPANTVLTPHVGEMSRLSRMSVDAILSDRIGTATLKARDWNCVIVLKGAYSVIAAPTGMIAVVPFATDALAKAGTGDVLAGCIVGLMSQGCGSFEAAVAAAYIHGLAGLLAGETHTTRSVVASDVLEMIPNALARLEALTK